MIKLNWWEDPRCPTSEILYAYKLNRGLSNKEREKVDKHLKECSTCIDRLKDIESTIKADMPNVNADNIEGLIAEERTHIWRNIPPAPADAEIKPGQIWLADSEFLFPWQDLEKFLITYVEGDVLDVVPLQFIDYRMYKRGYDVPLYIDLPGVSNAMIIAEVSSEGHLLRK